jgi:hypothetical protein
MDYFNQFLDWLLKLQTLPAVILVFLSCIVFGYAWRFIRFKWFPNDAIPVAVILWGSLAMCLAADPASSGMRMRIWIIRNVMIGAIVGFLAWVTHAALLKKLEQKLLTMFPGFNTAFFAKEPGNDVAQQSKENDTPKP